MSFSFGSFGEGSGSNGSAFTIGQSPAVNSSTSTNNQLKRPSNSLSFHQPETNTTTNNKDKDSIDDTSLNSVNSNNNSSRFGTGSLRKSSSLRFSSHSSNIDHLASSPKDESISKQELSNTTKLPNLKFDFSQSKFTTPSSQIASPSTSNPYRPFGLFHTNNSSSNIKKLVINHNSSSETPVIRRKKRTRKNSFEYGLKSPSLTSAASSANSSVTNTPNKHRRLNSSLPLGTPLRNPAISRIYEINKTAVDSGYWISPSLETLFSYTFEQLKTVKDLQIGRKNYGTIRYIDPVDLSTINNLSDILGNLVVFGHLTVCVYPDGKNEGHKASPGQELNKPAIITLENVFIYIPVGKVKLKLTDPADPRVKSHTDRFNERIKARGGEFITYDVSSGIYVFKVEHFSSWGFTEDDLLYGDDQEDIMEQDEPYQDQLDHPDSQQSNLDEGFKLLSPQNATGANGRAHNGFLGFSLDTSDQAYPQSFNLESSPTKDIILNNSSPPTFSARPNSQNVISLAPETATEVSNDDVSLVDERGSNFGGLTQRDDYHDQALALYESIPGFDDNRVANTWIEQLSFASMFDSVLAPPPFVPGSTREQNNTDAFLSKSNINAHDLDNAIFGGVSQMKIASTFGQYRQAATTLRLPEPFAPFSFAKYTSSTLLLKNENSPSTFIDGNKFVTSNISSHIQVILQDLLSRSEVRQRETGFPFSKPSNGLTFDYLKTKLPPTNSRDSSIILLASVLFDDLELHGVEPLNSILSGDAAKKQTEKNRARLLSQWLSNVVASDNLNQVMSASGDSLNQALAYLYGNKITDSALAASNGGNLHLATLISLLGSPGKEIRQTANSQISSWEKSGSLGYIPSAVRTIFEIISGNTTVSNGCAQSHNTKSAPTLYISQGLSWLQAFGLRLWYECTIEMPISESVKSYEKAFSSKESKVSSPFVADSDIRHVEFELLSLYSSKNPNLEALFNPLSSSGNAFDYQISWLLYHVLVRSLHLFEDPESKIGNKLCQEFAAQLEIEKKYLEAVFILSHITQDLSASQSIEQLIARNISELTDNDIAILTTKLGISPDVFSNARALKFRYEDDYWRECEQLIIAKNFEEAHYRVIRKVAPKAVISNNLDDLLTLLLSFKSPQTISNWKRGCQVYLDYIYIVEELASREHKLSLEVDGDYYPVSTKSTGDRARRAYADSGLSVYDVGLRLMNGLAEIDLANGLFNVQVAVNIMATFIGKNIKALGLTDKASLALQMKMDAAGYRQQTLNLSEIYFRNKVSAS